MKGKKSRGKVSQRPGAFGGFCKRVKNAHGINCWSQGRMLYMKSCLDKNRLTHGEFLDGRCDPFRGVPPKNRFSLGRVKIMLSPCNLRACAFWDGWGGALTKVLSVTLNPATRVCKGRFDYRVKLSALCCDANFSTYFCTHKLEAVVLSPPAMATLDRCRYKENLIFRYHADSER